MTTLEPTGDCTATPGCLKMAGHDGRCAVLGTEGARFTLSNKDVQPVVVPAQVEYPWRAALRTFIVGVLGLAAIFPVIAANVNHVPDWLAPILLGAAAVAGAITRIAAIPEVNSWLTNFLGIGAMPSQRVLLQRSRKRAAK